MSVWIFTAVVAFALGLNLALLTPRLAQTAEDTTRARVAQASSALRAQLELLDARLSPRAAASSPDLVEAMKPPADPTQPVGKPDEKALRAAAAASPEPDLLIVASSEGAAVSRHGKPAAMVDDLRPLPLVKAMLDGGAGAPAFAAIDNQLYRVQGAKIPGSVGVVVVGALIDDRLSAQIRSQVDAEVTFLRGGEVVASSLPAQGDRRKELQRWSKNPGPGYGTIELRLPGLGGALDGTLPYGAARFSVRGALVPLESGTLAAVTVPASAAFGWIGRYQAFYLIGLAGLLLFGLLWGLVPAQPQQIQEPVQVRQPIPMVPEGVEAAVSRAAALGAGADLAASDRAPAPARPRDVPWANPGEEPSGPHAKAAQKEPEPRDEVTPPPGPPPRPPEDDAGSASAHQPTPGSPGAGPHPGDPLWASDPFTTSQGAFELPAPGAKAQPAGPTANGAPASGAQKGDFSFAGLLDEAKTDSQGASKDASAPAASAPTAQDYPDITNPGTPSPELLAQARGEQARGPEGRYFPGDEPTRIEPVSAALLDKLRERDDEPLGPASVPAAEGAAGASNLAGWPEPSAAWPAENAAEPSEEGAGVQPPPDDIEALAQAAALAAEPSPESAPAADPALEHASAAEGAGWPSGQTQPDAHPEEPQPAPAPAAPEQSMTLSDFSFSRPADQDPDEAHFKETFEKFVALRVQTGEPADRVSYERFAAKLRKNREDLLAKHSAKGVRFVVYLKDGKAAIKASAIR